MSTRVFTSLWIGESGVSGIRHFKVQMVNWLIFCGAIDGFEVFESPEELPRGLGFQAGLLYPWPSIPFTVGRAGLGACIVVVKSGWFCL